MNPRVNIYYNGKVIHTIIMPRTYEHDIRSAVSAVKMKLSVRADHGVKGKILPEN